MELGSRQFDKFSFLSIHDKRVQEQKEQAKESKFQIHITKKIYISRGMFILKLMGLNFKTSLFLLSPSRGLVGL